MFFARQIFVDAQVSLLREINFLKFVQNLRKSRKFLSKICFFIFSFRLYYYISIPLPETYSELWQTNKMECFAKIVKGFQALTFSQNIPSQQFDMVLNKPLSSIANNTLSLLIKKSSQLTQKYFQLTCQALQIFP